MVVICSKCEARLQLDDARVPARSFKVRCPKCQSSIDVQPVASSPEPTGTMSLPDEMTPPTSTTSPFERPAVAAPFRPMTPSEDTSNNLKPDASVGINDLARLLASLQNTEIHSSNDQSKKRSAWSRRKALICTSPAYRETVAEGLVTHEYDVFIAENTPQALGRMREDRMDVLVLDANFDPVEQGFAFVSREVKLLRPADRRRLFLAYLTPTARTMDLHAAFLNNVNLVVNPSEVEQLPEALEVSIRHYNELYRDFNRLLDVPAI